MSRCRRGAERAECGDLRVAPLLFADDVAALGRFAAECEEVRVRIKARLMVQFPVLMLKMWYF